MAVSDAEHMVSTGMLGPRKLKTYDTRFATDPKEFAETSFAPPPSSGP